MRLAKLVIQCALALLCAAAGASAKAPEQVAGGVYLVGGSCNVYAIVRGAAALLIDSGEGDVIGQLDALGVKNVEWVVHTHAHRDQCAATPRLAEMGARVAVLDEGERFYRDPAGFWNQFQLYIRYQFKPDSFKPARPIPVHRVLADGESLEWRGITLTALATPGHSVDHTAWLAEIGGSSGKKIAFTGDMIHSPGKVWNLFHFDHHYWDGGFEGVRKTLAGLDKVLEWGADMLLPSHGVPIGDPPAAVALLKENMHQLYEFSPEGEAEDEVAPPSRRVPQLIRQVSEHLYHVRPTGYVLLDGQGGALFYDYYSVPEENSRWGPSRIDTILKALDIERVEVAIPSHFHEDHLRGFPVLKKLGAQYWVFDNMADLLAHPSRYNLCCIAPEQIPADRVLHDNEVISWGPYTFRIIHFPGQTMYHQAMYGEVDGRKVMFMGDTDCYALGDQTMGRRNLKLHGISTFFNYYNLDQGRGYEKAMERMVEFDPELMLFAHSGPREGNMLTYQTNLDSIRLRRARVEKVLPHEDPNLGFDPNRFCFYPYSGSLSADGTLDAELRVRNHLARKMKTSIEFRLPPGWRAEPQSAELEVFGKTEAAVRFKIIAPSGEKLDGRRIVTARIIADGIDWGEFCEMLVEAD
ncbi:MAG: MBL fold metallo-hydrolase [Candidatus Glassbacteria bacterium]|nr:MBL fold metallo-hydrolase [Candidatus Glassbacteria bacterium]